MAGALQDMPLEVVPLAAFVDTDDRRPSPLQLLAQVPVVSQ
jgi:hypothetical protein